MKPMNISLAFLGCSSSSLRQFSFPQPRPAGCPTLHLGWDAQPMLSTEEVKHQKLALIVNKPPQAEPKEAATLSPKAKNHCCFKGWVCPLLRAR